MANSIAGLLIIFMVNCMVLNCYVLEIQHVASYYNYTQNFSASVTTGNVTVHEQSVTYHVQVSATIRGTTGIFRESQLSAIDTSNTIFVPLPGKYHFLVVAFLFIEHASYKNESTINCLFAFFCPKELPVPQNVEVARTTNSSVSLSWDRPPPPRDEISEFQVRLT